MANEQTSKGTIVRGADGSLYFLREEVLEACKITEPDMAAFCQQLLEKNQGDVQGFTLATGPVVSAVSLAGPFAGGGGFGARAAGTIMCPGVMKDNSFVSLPASRL